MMNIDTKYMVSYRDRLGKTHAIPFLANHEEWARRFGHMLLPKGFDDMYPIQISSEHGVIVHAGYASSKLLGER